MPRVSIIMPVYNGERYLARAVDSMLAQTFTEFEFIILDDCSTDATPDILARYDDPRIRVFRNEENLRITRTLNKGFDLATGEYIARMDSDDFSFPERLQTQVEYLDSHPEVGLLGTRVYLVDDDDRPLENGLPSPRHPGTAGYTQWSLLWATTIWHPTAIIRRQVLLEHDLRYDPAFEPAEDYDLWARINRHCTVIRLAEPLLYYRMNTGGISCTRVQEQAVKHAQIMQREIGALLGEPVALPLIMTLAEVVRNALRDNPDGTLDLMPAAALLSRIRARFTAGVVLTPTERRSIRQEVAQRFHQMLRYAKRHRRYRLTLYLYWRIFDASPRYFLAQVLPYLGNKARTK
ncbi:MAG: glycosyltransferase [Anaerolineae bacterium]|nr:glycosyltransferase [Anaerolineae bacterium]